MPKNIDYVKGDHLSFFFPSTVCVNESESCLVMCNCLQPHGIYSLRNSPGQDTEVGSLSLLQGIFPTQGSNPGLPHCRWILYQLSHNILPLYVSVIYINGLWASQVALVVKNPPANVKDMGNAGLIPGLGRSPGEGHGNPLTPVFLPGESHGQRSLAGYSQSIGLQRWLKQLNMHITHVYIGTYIHK